MDQIDANLSLIFDKLDSWLDGAILLLPNLVIALLLLFVVWLLSLLVGRMLRQFGERSGRRSLGNVGGAMARWMIMIAGFLFAATIVLPSISPGDLFAGLGVSSVAIGFAFKDILQNLLSGILILVRQPFSIGDQIVSSGHEGTVEEIEARATIIRTYDGRRVVIPNAEIYTGSVVVNTAYEHRRSQYDFGIGGDEDIDRAVMLIVEAAKGCEGVAAEPAPEAFIFSIDDSWNSVRLRWWTKSDQSSVVHTRGRVLKAAYGALHDAGCDLPFPTRTINMVKTG